MGRANPPGDPPPALCVAVGPREASYELDAGLVAAHAARPTAEDGAQKAAPISTLEGGSVTVWRAGEAPAKGHGLGPVYRASPGGALAVPTGRVFVRFRDGERVEGHRDDLSAAGYVLESVPAYAPQAGWLRPTSARVADALTNLDRLRELPGVKHVEPQLVMERARRT
jgi:hypothetical protein